MAPFAGRIRRGRFAFRGRDYELPLNMAPHAIHGVVFDRPWDVVSADTISVRLGAAVAVRGDGDPAICP